MSTGNDTGKTGKDDSDKNTPRYALLSVSDKTGIVDFASALVSAGFTILSTGGTASLLKEHGVSVTEVSEHTGFPEIMAGRVKTLHPKIHGGLLGRRGADDEVMQSLDIGPIDIVAVNLYPFEATIRKPDCTLAEAIENIDIGGPAMVRSAAKNNASVTIVTDPADYHRVIDGLQNETLGQVLRFDLAAKAFEHTSRYDGLIASYLGARVAQAGDSQDQDAAGFSRTLNLQFQRVQTLRYGENPHQKAAFYREHESVPGSVAFSNQLQGKALSYNNIADTDAALECVKQFEQPACVIVKHANPCGVAECGSLLEAYDLAFETDPTSAFGGIIAFNRELDEQTAVTIIERQFVEVIIAPGIQQAAADALQQKANVRVLDSGSSGVTPGGMHMARVNGGMLIQSRDEALYDSDKLRVVTARQPDDQQHRDLLFAWKVAKFVKSNAIVYARDSRTIGVGAGQMSRVYSSKIAAIKAADENLQVKGSVMASDAFFPFRDGIDAAAEAGIAAVIQPGGSINDDEVIAAANEHGMSMLFTGMRHFRH